jgi:hypothetical protein
MLPATSSQCSSEGATSPQLDRQFHPRELSIPECHHGVPAHHPPIRVSVPLQFVQAAIAGTGKHPAEHPTGALRTIPQNSGLQYPSELLPFIWKNSPIVMRFLTADLLSRHLGKKTNGKVISRMANGWPGVLLSGSLISPSCSALKNSSRRGKAPGGFDAILEPHTYRYSSHASHSDVSTTGRQYTRRRRHPVR